MGEDSASFWLSVIATVLAVLSFCGAGWRLWRDRPRLRFTVATVIQHNTTDDKKFNSLQIGTCNLGFRPIILTGFKAVGRTGAYYMGDNDPTAMAYGVGVQVFPKMLNPGETLKIYPLAIEALQRNQTDPQNSKHHFNPWQFFVFEDSFGKTYPLPVQEVLHVLHLPNSWKRPKGWGKLIAFFQRKWFFYKYVRNRF